MISLKIKCLGIIPPLQKQFFLYDYLDEIIFFNTFVKISSKIKRGLRINLDESIWLYSGYIIMESKFGNNFVNMLDNISKLLTEDMVMIGVSDIMKDVYFEIALEKNVSSSYFKPFCKNSI